MNWGRVLVAIAFATFAVGVGAIVAPGTFAVGIDRFAVIVLGFLALGQTVRIVQTRRHGRRVHAETADPELPPSVASPGDDLDSILSALGRSRRRAADRRRQQLRELVIETLSRYRGVDDADAREQVDSGSWTDDRIAGAFLATDDEPPSLSQRLRTRLSGASPYWTGIDHTVAAIADVAGVPAERDTADDRSVPGLDRLHRSVGESLNGRDAGVERDRAIEDIDPIERATEHWQGIGAGALAAIGVGVLAQRPSVLLVGVVALGYAAYARPTSAPAATLALARSVEPSTPDPGDPVTITLSITNDGDRLLPDVRVVDGVPPALSVTDGSPRIGTALRPGETATVTVGPAVVTGILTAGVIYPLVLGAVGGAVAVLSAR